jgi:hypothetical protein
LQPADKNEAEPENSEKRGKGFSLDRKQTKVVQAKQAYKD